MSELARRVVFAIVAAPLALLLVYAGDAWLATLLAVAGAVGAWELFRIARAGGVEPLDALGITLSAALPLAAHAHVGGVFTSPPALWAVAVLGLFAVAIWARGVSGRPLSAVAVTAFGAAYTGGMLSFAYLLRYHPYAVGRAAGTAVAGLPLLLTWASDIGAYFVGRAIGRRKLIPSVSPGKTVEGSLGGLAATVVVCWVYVREVLQPLAQLAMRPAAIVLFGVVIGAAAQLGDLAESLLKREAGVKDSSRLLPGHGGVLDRLDSLFFVLPVAYLVLGWTLLPAYR